MNSLPSARVTRLHLMSKGWRILSRLPRASNRAIVQQMRHPKTTGTITSPGQECIRKQQCIPEISKHTLFFASIVLCRMQQPISFRTGTLVWCARMCKLCQGLLRRHIARGIHPLRINFGYELNASLYHRTSCQIHRVAVAHNQHCDSELPYKKLDC